MANKQTYAAAKAAVSMQSLLGFYYEGDLDDHFKKRGEQLRGKCPFCETKQKASLSLNTKRNCYKSFCCASQGNVLDFVASMENVEIDEALELLIEWFKIDIEMPGSSRKENNQASPVQSISSNEPLTFELKNIDHGHEEVKTLGISEKTAAAFGVGYYGGRGMFKGDVVFPIHNELGQLISYAGLGADEDYRYPEKFRKDLALYNLHRVSESLKTYSDPIIIVSGFLEVLHLHETGVRHAIASMGAYISQEQMNLISGITNVSNQNLRIQNAA